MKIWWNIISRIIYCYETCIKLFVGNPWTRCQLKTGAEQECTLKMIMMVVILYFYVYVDRCLVKMREGEFKKRSSHKMKHLSWKITTYLNTNTSRKNYSLLDSVCRVCCCCWSIFHHQERWYDDTFWKLMCGLLAAVVLLDS